MPVDAGNNLPGAGRALTRRDFIAAGLLALATRGWAQYDLDRIGTPYKLGKYVLTASGQEGSFDKVSVDCPSVFRHQGAYFMTFVAFDGVGYQTGLALSPDLVNWKKEGCILKRDPSSSTLKYNVALNWILRENGLYSPGELTQVDGYFLGAYHAYPNAGLEQGAAVIGLCRSKDLRNWIVDPPCLRPEDGAAWERGGLYKPCVLRHEGKYYIFYNAKNQTEGSWREQTGVAISKDLKRWTRYSANPVIANGVAGSPDEKFASDPCVLKDGHQWVLYYYGLDAKGVARDLAATSPDLLHTTKCSKILIDIGPKGSIDSTYAHKPSLIQYQRDLYHYYCAVSNDSGREIRGISVARSRPWRSE
ncbi:MAG TPA: family 43 glycosylhydrolase [Terriglobia bacterium]|nr:family 43 glycosylhydrolase [Terriglobia bacterium]